MDEGVREIPLSRGLVALVDAADFDWLNQWKWSFIPASDGRGGYAKTKVNGGLVRMHRLIAGALPGEIVDHISGDGLDNRRANLRICTHAQNMQNAKPRRDSTSGFKGVRVIRGRWEARIEANGKRVVVGYFSTPAEAAKAYDRAARILHGDFARLNFPEAA